MRYIPLIQPEVSDPKLEVVLEWVRKEFDQISQVFTLQDFVRLEELHAVPSKLFTGLTVLADGTDWNPGSGQGVYTYYNGGWNKLG